MVNLRTIFLRQAPLGWKPKYVTRENFLTRPRTRINTSAPLLLPHISFKQGSKLYSKLGQAWRVAESSNPRLEAIFGTDVEYVNRELTLPCAVANPAAWIHPNISGTPFEAAIRSQLRVVVSPFQIPRLSPLALEHVQVLASPLECGRVLELDQTMDIGGKPYVITMKGIGTTEFIRELEMVSFFEGTPGYHVDPKLDLRRYPYNNYYGTLDLRDALIEAADYRILETMDHEAQKVLAVYQITHLPDETGRHCPISYFRNQGIFTSRKYQKHWGVMGHDKTPAIIVRAVKTNFRMLDLYMLEKLGHHSSIPKLIEHIHSLFAIHHDQPQASISDYFHWLVRRVVSQRLRAHFIGLSLGPEKSHDLARNISLLGEQMDQRNLADYLTKPIEDLTEYRENFSIMFGCVEWILMEIARMINQYYPEKIDEVKFADTIWQAVEDQLDPRTTDFETIVQRFKEPMSSENLQHMIRKEIFNWRLAMRTTAESLFAYKNRIQSHKAALLD